jgi:hypothetical protein
MVPADKVVSNITLHFCVLKKRHCDENPAIQGGYGCIMVKLVGCGPVLWVVLLTISWVWNMSNITSKNASILRKRNSILYSILRSQNTPRLCSIPVGVFTLLVPIHGVGTREKNPYQWHNQFSMRVLHFYSIQYSIDLIGICLKIVLDSM